MRERKREVNECRERVCEGGREGGKREGGGGGRKGGREMVVGVLEMRGGR